MSLSAQNMHFFKIAFSPTGRRGPATLSRNFFLEITAEFSNCYAIIIQNSLSFNHPVCYDVTCYSACLYNIETFDNFLIPWFQYIHHSLTHNHTRNFSPSIWTFLQHTDPLNNVDVGFLLSSLCILSAVIKYFHSWQSSVQTSPLFCQFVSLIVC